MKHLGDFDASTVVYGKFTTFQPSTGAAFTLGGTPALSVYKDNSTTQSTSGVTLTASFDSVTGLNHFAIDTSSDGTFYSAGSFFDIVITTGTVDSVSVVGAVVGSFTIRKTSSLKPTTAARTLDVSAGGEAGVDWANVGSPTTSLNLSGTTVKTATDVETDTQDIQARLPAALVGGRMDANVGAISTDATAADNLEAMLDGTGGVTLTTAITGNITGNLSGSVGSVTGAVGSVTGAVGSVTGAVGSVTGNVGGNVAGSVASVTGNVGGNVAGSVGSVAAGVTVTTNNDKTGYALSAAGVDAVIDDVVEGTTTFRQMLRGFAAALLGKASGLATTTAVYRDVGDTKDRITATVDADGNRSAVTLDLT